MSGAVPTTEPERCEGCGRTGLVLNQSERYGGRWICFGCLNPLPVHQDQEPGPGLAARMEDEPTVLLTPPGVQPSPEAAELYELIELYERGKLVPAEVTLGPLPGAAGEAMRKAAADIELLIGLRLAVDDDRPLPYATSFARDRLGLCNKSHASRVLRSLVEAGVIVDAGELPKRGKGNGTKTYAPPVPKPTAFMGASVPSSAETDAAFRQASR